MDNSIRILEKLIYATKIRHKVYVSNIANVDTPHYKAKDVDFKELMNSEIKELAATHPRHIRLAPEGETVRVISKNNPSWDDKNNVELDMEVAKMTENALLYEAGIRLLSTKMRMIRNAIRGR